MSQFFVTQLKMLMILVSLLLPLYAIADWSQLYGGAHSTNYVDISRDNIVLGWNYTVKEEYAIFYGAPAVSETGVVYLPYLEYPQYWLQLRAVRPNGSEMWMANWIGSDDSCSVVFLTNAVYSKEHNLVVLGWTCTTAGAYYQKHGQLMAYDATDGSEVWRSQMLYDANDMSSISISSDVVFASGGYDCGRDGATLYEMNRNPRLFTKSYLSSKRDLTDKNNISQIVAVDIKNGKLLHTLDIDHVGCYTQTKVFPTDSGAKLLLPANLPDSFDCEGSLLSLKCSSSGKCSKEWLKNIGLSWDAKFAYNRDGSIVFGSNGLKGNPDLIFGLKTDTGETLFSNKGYCNSDDDYPSGPAVDEDGNAYYRFVIFVKKLSIKYNSIIILIVSSQLWKFGFCG